MIKMKTAVYYDYGQMRCCGDPFSVGDMVDWDCIKMIWSVDIKADYWYETHGITEFNIVGQVIEIYAINYQYKRDENNYLHPISYTSEPIQTATEYHITDGYLAILDNVTIIKE